MKLGIGLPNTMPNETDRRLMLEWADILIVIPQIPDLKQVESLARDVLPAYR